MLKMRIIPCLDVKDGRVVKGVNFVDLVDAGDPVEQARLYDAAGADELEASWLRRWRKPAFTLPCTITRVPRQRMRWRRRCARPASTVMYFKPMWRQKRRWTA